MASTHLAGNGHAEEAQLLLERERAKERVAELEGCCRLAQPPWIEGLVQHLNDGFALLSPRGVFLEVNPALCAMTGYGREELIGAGIPHPYWPPEERQRLTRILRRDLEGPQETIEATFRRRGGERFPVLISPSVVRDEAGKTVCLLATVKDIGERRRAEQALTSSNRALRTLTSCNQALLRATDEETLLAEICHIACEAAGYRMAWVGYAEHDASKRVRPVAWAGHEAGYLASLDISWADTPRGRGPTGSAIRSGETIYTSDSAHDPRTAPWRKRALARGYRSSIALPLKGEDGSPFGALTIYAATCDAFTLEERQLLEELADDLAFGIRALRGRAEREQTEAARRASEARYRALFEENRAIKLLIDPSDGAIVDASPSAADFYGYSREQLQKLTIGDLNPLPSEEVVDAMARARHEGLCDFAFQHRLASGELRDVEVNSGPLEVQGRTLLFSIVQDVTKRKRSEAALRESEVRYRTVVENAPIGIFQSTLEGQLVYANPACAHMFGCVSPEEMLELINRRGLGAALYSDEQERRRLVGEVHKADGEWTSFTAHLRHRDGGVHTAQLYACERRDPLGGQLGLFGFVEDVTAQEEATRALARSMQLLSHGERLAHVGSWEIDVAAETHAVSGEWQRMHGLEGPVQSNAAVEATCHPDDREAVRQAMTETAGGGAYRVEHRIIHPTTHEVRCLSTYGEPVFDAEGRLERILGASLDVTERVRADAALWDREGRLKRSLEATVGALGATVAMRDPYTADHERRVAELACAIATALGWSEDAVARLRTAALVHDVGKIAVPAELLAKPTRLSVAEFALIQGHAQAAYEILAPIDFDGPVAELVRQHHERLDGSGYPQGLAGEQILPGARLLALADVVEAMVSHRPYRPALPLEAALAEIESGAGVRYDATGVAACRALFAEGFGFSD